MQYWRCEGIMSGENCSISDSSANVFSSSSLEETEKIGALLASSLRSCRAVLLYGDLGAGKTAFVRGLASVLAPAAHVCSPTYAVVNEYPTPSGEALRHWDMYRVESEDDLVSCGYFDRARSGYDAIEWCENIEDSLPDDAWRVTIEKIGDDCRKITIEKI